MKIKNSYLRITDDPLSKKRSTRHELEKLNGDQKTKDLNQPEESPFDTKEIVKESEKQIQNRFAASRTAKQSTELKLGDAICRKRG